MTRDATGVADLEVVSDRRGNAFRVDAPAFVRNVERARTLLAPDTRLFQVVKGQGYGVGVARAVRLGLAAGIDGFCAGTPEEAIAAVDRAEGRPVILFTACPPGELARVARPGLIVTVNTPEALATVAAIGDQPYLLELECGFGRFGFDEAAVQAALRSGTLARQCLGAYTHFGSRSQDQLEAGLQRLDTMIGWLRPQLGADMLTMVAASHTMIWRPGLPYSAADPGSLLYGLLPQELAPGYEPVVSHVAASLLQVNRIGRAQRLSIGYGSQAELRAGGRTGVIGLGWRDGLPLRAVGTVLVNGTRAPVIGRTLLHTILDLSDIPGDVAIGDEVVLVGRQGHTALDLVEAAAQSEVTPTQFHFQLLDAISRPLAGEQ